MTKSTPTPAILAQQRSAQAARAFMTRPQAGVQGAPQNRAERRAAARNAGRKPATSTLNKPQAVRAERTSQPLNAGQVLAQAPVALARDVSETVRSVRNDISGVPLFPVRQMRFSLPLLVLFAVLMVGWWNIVGANPAWLSSVKPYMGHVTAFVTGGFFLGLLCVSARSYLPALLAVGVALMSAFLGDRQGLFGPGILVAGVLGLAWVVGPLPGLGGKFWRRKKA